MNACPNDPKHVIRVEANGKGKTIICVQCRKRYRGGVEVKR